MTLAQQLQAVEDNNRVVYVEYTALAFAPAFRIKHVQTFKASTVSVRSTVEYYDSEWDVWQGTRVFDSEETTVSRARGWQQVADISIMHSERIASRVLKAQRG